MKNKDKTICYHHWFFVVDQTEFKQIIPASAEHFKARNFITSLSYSQRYLPKHFIFSVPVGMLMSLNLMLLPSIVHCTPRVYGPSLCSGPTPSTCTSLFTLAQFSASDFKTGIISKQNQKRH